MRRAIRRKTIKESINNSDYMSAVEKHFNYNITNAVEDVFVDLVDRAMMEDCEDSYECVSQAIDEGLIYTNDQWTMYRFYCDMGDPVEQMYEGLLNDLVEIVEEIQNNEIEERYKRFPRRNLK